MTTPLAQHIQQAIESAEAFSHPFQHWSLHNILPEPLAQQFLATPMPNDPAVCYDGTRAGNSKITPGGKPPERLFLSAQTCEAYPYFKSIIDAFLTKTLCQTLHNIGVTVEKRYLRIEYIVDRNGFFLEPHLDIGEKELTFQIYLGNAPESCGTDLYDSNLKHVKSLRFKHNHGYCFVPGKNTWHGLERNAITAPRCSMIVNYVTFTTDWPVPFTHAELKQSAALETT